MNNDTLIQLISEKIRVYLAETPSEFLVEVRIKPTNNVKVFIDGDEGVTIQKCISLNRKLAKDLEENQVFPADDFSLEVSSPGLDEPLKQHRQYKKNIGRKVEVTLVDGTVIEGKLLSVDETSIQVEELTGKKKVPVLHNFLLENIKTTKIQVVFWSARHQLTGQDFKQMRYGKY